MLGRLRNTARALIILVGRWDAAIISLVVVVLLAISVGSVLALQPLNSEVAPRAPWCPPGEVPGFEFGFGTLAEQIGTAMGTPTECEHGDNASENIVQATTTGLAVYDWCTNTSGFTSGQDHWMLTPQGLEHWTGNTPAPRPLPVVRAPDLRHLCQT